MHVARVNGGRRERAFEATVTAFARLKIAFYSNRDVSNFIQIRLEQ
jgi:hypothetical protein